MNVSSASTPNPQVYFLLTEISKSYTYRSAHLTEIMKSRSTFESAHHLSFMDDYKKAISLLLLKLTA